MRSRRHWHARKPVRMSPRIIRARYAMSFSTSPAAEFRRDGRGDRSRRSATPPRPTPDRAVTARDAARARARVAAARPQDRAAAAAGSADALALAQLARATAAAGARSAVVCADALAGAAPRRRDRVVRAGAARRAAARLGDAALRSLLAAPGPGVGAARDALPRSRAANATCVLVAATTALYRLPPPSYLAAFTFFLTQGETLDVDALRAQLALAGYTHVTQVVSPGEFSVRGGLIDLFPMGSRAALPDRPLRQRHRDRSRRSTSTRSARSIRCRDVRLLPAREFPLDEAGRTRFRSRFREVFEGDPSKSPLYKDVCNGIVPGGIEYYLPLFFEATATLADYLPRDAVVALHGDVAARDRALLAGHRVALQAAARRQGAAAAAAARALPAAGRVQRRAQAVRAHRAAAAGDGDRRAGRRADAPSAAGAGRSPRRRSARAR